MFEVNDFTLVDRLDTTSTQAPLKYQVPRVTHRGSFVCTVNYYFFKLLTRIDRYIVYFLWNCPQWNVTRPHWCLVNTGSGYGFVPLGNKPVPEPMLTNFYDDIWHHYATMSQLIWPGGTICQMKCLSTLVQAMTCCLAVPSHFLKQCSLTVYQIFRNIFPWNYTQHSNIFIRENVIFDANCSTKKKLKATTKAFISS